MGRHTAEEEKKLKQMEKIKEERAAAEQAPAEIAFSMKKEPGQGWQFITYHIKNGKVVNTEIKECTDKEHAIETYKLSFVYTFIQGR